MKNLSYHQAMERTLKHQAVLIDVRPSQEYLKYHLAESINIPLEQLSTLIEWMIPNHHQELILCCQHGIRSMAGCEILKQKGYTIVYNLQNGF